MRKQWTWLFIVIMLAAGLVIGCRTKEDIVVTDEETLCAKVLSVKDDGLLVEVGNMEEILEFISAGEERTIAISSEAEIITMNGIKKTSASIQDVGVGDILAVTLKSGEAVTIVIHSRERLE